MGKSLVALSAILLLAFDLANSELCERKSQTFSGLVCHNHKCDRRCIGWEKAQHGACHLRDWVLGCYCYYDDCAKAPPPSPGGGGGAGGGSGGKGDGSGKGDGGGKGAVGGGGGGNGGGGGSGNGGGGSGGGTDNPCN